MLVKIILVFCFLMAAAYLMRTNLGAKQTAWGRIGMLFFCVLAIVTVLIPSISTRIAHLIGVGRGADLLLYILVIVFLFTQLSGLKHRNEQQRRLTRLAREIALNQALIADQLAAAKAAGTAESKPTRP